MNREEIIRMAREAGCLDESHYGSLWADKLIAFAALVAAAEREACAKVAEKMLRFYTQAVTGVPDAIRARGEK
jgi:hypothetical protein